ncbi:MULTISPECIES: GNAT family N-acetyltransferase [Streptomyces]|uniref:GNAT family N-acetyltransferase n=1 Tax=Streptomyces lycii TaxID=2654337 RepID=A0ABQ7FNX0_9ACTN|nr:MULTISPECIES: GNAT family N-acetyltransferase [Streptomyces]KAF4410402.1 GNAT family N-acetyltransferase [Streptomyces lycii]PGH47126.1 GNAT family N-acetyltransferase [Streptomyces sp. Ru87]
MDFTTGGRLVVRITAADVGKRVSVRRLADGAGPAEKFTDTVGVLTSWDAGVLRITRRSGETVRVPEDTLVAGKVVPDAPVRRRGPAADAAELVRAGARAWPPIESEPLGDWLLRASGGFTRRANSVLALGDPGMPLDTALRRVTGWYAERELPAYLQAAPGAEAVEEALAGRGWTREVAVRVRTAALAPLADTDADAAPDADAGAPNGTRRPRDGSGTGGGTGAADGGGTGRVRLSRDIDAAWMSRYQRSAEPSPEALAVLRGGPSVWFATVPGDAGAPPAAIGRCVVDGRWAGFSAVEVDPAARRRGLARAVMAALARRALAEGASAAHLQVEVENRAANALYDRLGFTTRHLYHHWRAPREDAR